LEKNIVTCADQLFQFAQDEESELADPATKEALRCQSALMQNRRQGGEEASDDGNVGRDLPDAARDRGGRSERARHGADRPCDGQSRLHAA
jgi:hypothetical protein